MEFMLQARSLSCWDVVVVVDGGGVGGGGGGGARWCRDGGECLAVTRAAHSPGLSSPGPSSSYTGVFRWSTTSLISWSTQTKAAMNLISQLQSKLCMALFSFMLHW